MRPVRVAAHVHSEWSYDASWSLSEIARAFSKRRYDAVLMAEHDVGFSTARWADYQRACAAASTDDIVLIPGIEYQESSNVVHLPVWGAGVPFLGSDREPLTLLRAAADEGAVAVFAHPWRQDAFERYDPSWAPLLSAVEVWNRKYDGLAPDRRAATFARREGLAPIVSLDFHTARQFFPLAMTMDIERPVSAPAVIEVVREGRCHAEVLGISALRFTRGLEGVTARALERARRGAAGPLRHFRADGPRGHTH